MKIDFEINGGQSTESFLRNPEISFYLTETFQKFNDQFPGIEGVKVNLKSKYIAEALSIRPRKLGKLNGNIFEIEIEFDIYRDGKGKPQHDSPRQVFDRINWVMKDEINHYLKEYERVNPSLLVRLMQKGINMKSNKDVIGNELKGSLGTAGYQLNFEKRINELSEQDLYQLGSVIIVSGSSGRIFSQSQIVDKMRDFLKVQ